MWLIFDYNGDGLTHRGERMIVVDSWFFAYVFGWFSFEDVFSFFHGQLLQ